jgi:uncharacterized protein YprB with RNaseH-like and TPR domain
LWNKYRRGDEEALETLIKYNKEDVENLKTIIDMKYQKMMDNEVKPEE